MQKGTNRTVANEWRDVPFADLLVEPVRNGIYKRKEFHGRGIKVVNMGELFANPRLHDVYMRRVELSESERHRFSVQARDLLFARRSLVAEGAGKCSVVLEINELTAFESSIIRARPDPTKTDSLFLYYYFNSPIGLHALDSIRRQVAVAGITGTDLSQLSVRVPPLPEQRVIAHVLGTLDDKIELNRRMNETLEAVAQALFKSWFVDFEPVRAKMEGRWRRGESLPGLPAEHYDLFPDRLVDSELGEIPEGWGVKELGELVDLAYGKALRATERKGGPIPVYGSNGQIGWHDEGMVAGPGIVVGRKGNPGVVTWAHSDFVPIDTTFYVIPRDDNGGLPFLFFALTNQDLPSVSADSAVPGLNRNLAYMNKQLIPGNHVVDAFNDYASAIFSRRRHLEVESRSLTTQRDALLPGLVSGEVEVAGMCH